MRYSILSDAYEELESTSKKLAKNEIIAKLLKKTPSEDLERVVLLLTERVFPPWDDREIGVAENLLMKAIAQAFEINPEDVENAWNSLPDYGEIARIAKEKGTKGLQKIELQLGVPCNVLLAEKVPDLKTALDSFENPWLNYKYDGMRVVIQKKGDKIWVFTRRLEDVTKAFP